MVKYLSKPIELTKEQERTLEYIRKYNLREQENEYNKPTKEER